MIHKCDIIVKLAQRVICFKRRPNTHTHTHTHTRSRGNMHTPMQKLGMHCTTMVTECIQAASEILKPDLHNWLSTKLLPKQFH